MAPKYSSVVIAPAQIVLGVISGIVLALILEALDSDLWPAAIIVFLVISALGYYLSSITMQIDDEHITIGQGRREKHPRVIYLAEVRGGEIRSLTWAQCFGIGIEDDERTTRLTVRPGRNLFLTLFDGEQIRISVNDIDGAVDALDLEVEPTEALTGTAPSAIESAEALASTPDFADPYRTDPVFVEPATDAPIISAAPCDGTDDASVSRPKPRPRPKP